jgi:hypothetical protein
MKLVFYFSIVATVAFVVIGIVNSRNSINEDFSATKRLEPTQVTIEFSEGRPPVSGSLEHGDPMTAFDLLKAIAASKRLKVDYSGQGETLFVKSIDGIVGGENQKTWWVYLVNGTLAQQGSGTNLIQPGDQVTWRLGTYPQ